MTESQFQTKAEFFAQSDFTLLINNIAVDCFLSQSQNITMPTTVTQEGINQSWVSSPISTYCRYAESEAKANLPYMAALPIQLLCKALLPLLNFLHLDKMVGINNWLLSTNLYPDLCKQSIQTILTDVLAAYPQHAIWFRSLNRHHHSDWIDFLTSQGFILIPSRKVYLCDEAATALNGHKDFKRDLKLKQKTSLHFVSNDNIKDEDYQRIEELYSLLYLGKYSLINPQYTSEMMKLWQQNGLLNFSGFRDDEGVLQVITGIFENEKLISCPILGYNTDYPQKDGLYRLANLLTFEYALQHNKRMNLSAGAGDFKRQRGAFPETEYSAVYINHLPLKQRIGIRMIQQLSQKFALPIMNKLKL